PARLGLAGAGRIDRAPAPANPARAGARSRPRPRRPRDHFRRRPPVRADPHPALHAAHRASLSRRRSAMPTATRATDPPLRISSEALTPEERMRFQGVYDQIAGEYFNGRPPGTRQKLEFTRHLQQSWRRGWTAVGKTYKQINLTAPRRVTPATLAARAGAPRDRSTLLPLGLIGLALLAFGW